MDLLFCIAMRTEFAALIDAFTVPIRREMNASNDNPMARKQYFRIFF